MNTILTDDEMIAAVGAPAYLAAGRAVEAAVLAKLAQPADRHALQNQGKHPAPCARFCESKAYEIEIRQLKSQLEQADRQRVPDGWVKAVKVAREALKNVEENYSAGDEYPDSLMGPGFDPSKVEDAIVQIDAMLAAAPEAPAQASAVDERAAFEAWYSQNAFNFERDPIGSRECGLQWKAWQARAALAQKGGK